ncbi:MAG: NADP(H)-dependent aldo-keto reductase [Deltaproteobacteria bacterium]|nr:MAG: NADP(H)-dependent aldo-keto reductase [Deltaproteobacteria bacterium]TNF26318.1 MAG: NADP(H)-dependent aldo-keto reductase [Deltaproteobacteria bacterium]
MEYRKLGNTNIDVSVICLGTMTWGQQNTEQEAHQQLDFALDRGVNFIDTAEMYPVPPMPETYTRTEEYIGRWDKLKTQRDKIILATKVVGKAEWATYIRNGQACLNRENIRAALEASLKRLGTDYVDLYQLHWPDRSTNFFGQLGYNHVDENFTPVEETLAACDELVKEGKVRHFGISNETPWGTMKYLSASENKNLVRMVSVQNPYSLLNRTYEVGMAEVSIRENCGLLAYSPLGFGVLSGKYLGGKHPEGARLTLFDRFTRYTNPQATAATERYIDIAKRHGLDPAQMALSFVNSRPFLTSNIIGATRMDQLESNIASIDVKLSNEVLQEIDAVHKEIPNPAP